MKLRVTRNQDDQKSYLAYIDKNYVQKAKAAGETSVRIGTVMLEWLLEVANRAPRSKIGRPRKMPKMKLEEALEEVAQKKAELITEGRKANRLPTGGQIWDVTKRKAAETGYAEGYLEDLLQHPGRLHHPRSPKSKKKADGAD
jgi:flagellar biosynthesis/type III secretory pathway protein FliH